MNRLFEPFTIGSLTLKNRIVRAATHEGMAGSDGMPTEDLFQTYARLAAGGAGAIITGYAAVKGNGRTFPNMLLFDSDEPVPAYRSLNERLKPFGVPVILQIAHGGSRAMSKLTGEAVISASARRKNDYGDAVGEASEEEIQALIAAFADAVVRARSAGFDGVELHAAHGYLLSEFVSPVLNRRGDRWGGSTENRLRILTEILAAARKKAGGDFPILVKISGHDEFRRGLTEDEAVAMAGLLEAASCDAIEVSCGYGDFMYTIRMPGPPVEAILGLLPRYQRMPAHRKWLFRRAAPMLLKSRAPLHNYNVPLAERIGRQVRIPVIAVGGIRDRQEMEQIIAGGDVDVLALSRPFIIEPDIVKRLERGQPRSRCIDCGFCLMGVTRHRLRCYYGRIPEPQDRP